jgi:hypothetical protein
MDRFTYKNAFGDYGVFTDYPKDLYAIFAKLGAYEDLGTPEQFAFLRDRFVEEQEESPKPLIPPEHFLSRESVDKAMQTISSWFPVKNFDDLSCARDLEGWVK